MGARLRVAVLMLLVAGALRPSIMSFAPTSFGAGLDCEVRSVSFAVNGAAAPLTAARRGDRVEVTFDVPSGCTKSLVFASFVAPAPAFDGSRLSQQALFSKDAGVFGAGQHSLAVDVFDFPDDTVQDCSAAPRVWGAASDELRAAVRERMAASPAYAAQVRGEVSEKRAAHGAALGTGASEGAYDSACATAEPQNGDGDGAALGKPCAGCVGEADDNDPPGQLPDGNDHDAGHECDRNAGIGQGNPAHSSCRNFQIDLSSHPLEEAGSPAGQERHLIAAVFCIGTTSLCYATDRTGSNAVAGVPPH